MGPRPSKRQRDNLCTADKVTIPVQMLLQWDDEVVSRASGLDLYQAFGSTEKTLHVNPGLHHEVPRFEANSAQEFFTRQLLSRM
jgi:fermentation-respiration switch protein FrsA (DUF1100 family)